MATENVNSTLNGRSPGENSISSGNNRDPRDRVVEVSELQLRFPAPSRYDNAAWLENDVLAGNAPWFQHEALGCNGVVDRYAVDGALPGEIPLEATRSWSWFHQFSCRASDLFVPTGSTLERARAKFARMSQKGLERLRTMDLIPSDWSGMFVYRTLGEVDYLEALNAISSDKLSSWRGAGIVADDAWVWTKPQLVVDFRYQRKRGSYWTVFVKNERRLRSKHGRPIPWQCLSTFGVGRDFLSRAFCALTPFWSRIEVPRGMCVELPMVFSYKMRELHDPNSGYWVVAYTEMVIKTAAFLLFEVYDNFRLWALSPHTIEFIRTLDLDSALGSRSNATEILRLCTVIENKDYTRLPTEWRVRGHGVSLSGGRRSAGADWMYYDPWSRCEISAATAADYARRPREVPDGHPTGWDYSSVPDGWAAALGGPGPSGLVSHPSSPIVASPDIGEPDIGEGRGSDGPRDGIIRDDINGGCSAVACPLPS